MSLSERLLSCVFVLLLCVSFAVTGCGAADTASEKISTADDLLYEVQQGIDKTASAFEKAYTAVFDGLAEGRDADSVRFSEKAEALTKEITALQAKLDRARALYREVDRMSGVAEYSEYARMQLELSDLSAEVLTGMNTFLGETVEKITSPSFDPVAFRDYVQDYSAKLKSLAPGIKDAAAKSQEYRKKKEL